LCCWHSSPDIADDDDAAYLAVARSASLGSVHSPRSSTTTPHNLAPGDVKASPALSAGRIEGDKMPRSLGMQPVA